MSASLTPGLEVFTSRSPIWIGVSEPLVLNASSHQPSGRNLSTDSCPHENALVRRHERDEEESGGAVLDTTPLLDNNGPFPSLGTTVEGLTMQQILDIDIENLAMKIDKHHCHTKKAVLDHFMESKTRMLASQVQAVEEERKAGQRQLAIKQSEVELLREELYHSGNRGTRLSGFVTRLTAAYDLSKHRMRTLSLLHRAFRSWCHYVFIAVRARRRMERAIQWHSMELLQRKVLREWFRVAMQMHRVTLHNRYMSDLEAASGDMASQYEGQLETLREQLKSVHQQLSQEATARELLEENMKQAFMRGVCALNIEAMSIMKRGAPPGGANPVPILVSAAGGGTAAAAVPTSSGALGSGRSPYVPTEGPSTAGTAGKVSPTSFQQGSGAYFMAASPSPQTSIPAVVPQHPVKQPAANSSTGGPVLVSGGVTHSAQSYYQPGLPKVTVTRAPGGAVGSTAGSAGGGGDMMPKPRTAVPAPAPR
ncbi:hypothetical protein CEUSTIGMA_g12642.t1 [Chlamydomonas eustigma]|uniref:Centrosomal protein POC5 n=1 Tax=Chlamydomonas eustigma TaxID=1157962 RepID=A0A250XQK8_9CHLO|nr:hypothetical protein CEUSTIGMA_g12642.t1 [Chlamydomonas eustigma]|eukprot:GAX85222.1 hypothetical protein CEUSTIGMA_g12642.t1 [Chlamydomonas eustigma]